MSTRVIHPNHWPATPGYSPGVLAQGYPLFIAGQIGWNEHQIFETDDFIEQFAQALDHVLAVLDTAGGEVSDLTEMTIFVTDLDAYRTRTKELGAVWRKRMGRTYPAMALVGVQGLVEKRALVEIQARAVLSKFEDNSST
jgi:enamine deaminase RidA (YjgF/YER057c/UK114 family)